jgi:hypothetical protein
VMLAAENSENDGGSSERKLGKDLLNAAQCSTFGQDLPCRQLPALKFHRSKPAVRAEPSINFRFLPSIGDRYRRFHLVAGPSRRFDSGRS